LPSNYKLKSKGGLVYIHHVAGEKLTNSSSLNLRIL
jgi:hypothetical protein